MTYSHRTDSQLIVLAKNRLGLNQRGLGIKLGYATKSANVSINRIQSGVNALPIKKRILLEQLLNDSIETLQVKGKKFNVEITISKL